MPPSQNTGTLTFLSLFDPRRTGGAYVARIAKFYHNRAPDQ
jgi:hypothetical protein